MTKVEEKGGACMPQCASTPAESLVLADLGIVPTSTQLLVRVHPDVRRIMFRG